MAVSSLSAVFSVRRILCDPCLWRGSAIWVLLFLVLANVGVWRRRSRWAEDRRANLLMPALSGALQGTNAAAARPVRFDWSCGTDLPRYLTFIPDARSCPVSILCGMSQMFSINEPQPGDQTIAEWMDDELSPRGGRVFGLAAPNISNEEVLFLLLTLLQEDRTTPRVFIFGACFDKFRNVDLRPELLNLLRDRPGLRKAWETTLNGAVMRFPLAAEKIKRTIESVRETENQKEDSFEANLRGAVGKAVPVVQARRELAAEFNLTLFLARNKLLGIKPTSKRPVIRTRYDMNREFLSLACDLARERGVQMIIYVVPLNPRAENPYVPAEYAEFKQWIAEFTRERGIPFSNLESIVPSDEWGVFMGGPDFKHFKGSGHRRTATALIEHFGDRLVGEAAKTARKQ